MLRKNAVFFLKLVLLLQFALALTLFLPRPIASAAAIYSLPEAVTETLRIDGTDQMAAINERLQQAYAKQFPGRRVELQTNGTKIALEKLLHAEIDLAAIDRPLTPLERAKGLLATAISRDEIAIIIGRENPFSGSLTGAQLEKIFRGEIQNWADLGGADAPIRVIDRPANSDLRRTLQQYHVIPLEPATETTVAQQETDDLAAILQTLGSDGISYALASQLLKQDQARIVPLINDVEALRKDAYPYIQPFSYSYSDLSDAAQAFLGFATTQPGQAAIMAAKLATARTVALDEELPVQLAPIELPASTRTTPISEPFRWLWILLPLPLVLLLRGLVQRLRFKSTSPSESALAPVAPDVSAVIEPEAEPIPESQKQGDDLVEHSKPIEPSETLTAAPSEPAETLIAELAAETLAAASGEESIERDQKGISAESIETESIETESVETEQPGLEDSGIESSAESPELISRAELHLTEATEIGDAEIVTDQLQSEQVELESSVSANSEQTDANPANLASTALESASSGPGSLVPTYPESVDSVAEASQAVTPFEEAVPPTTAAAVSRTFTFKQAFLDALRHAGVSLETATPAQNYRALASAVCNQLINLTTPETYLMRSTARIVGQVSVDWMPGLQLQNSLINLDWVVEAEQAMQELGLDLQQLIDQEPAPDLGQDQLGPLLLGYLDALATANIPAIGYGIRYESGFDQAIQDGWQVEIPVPWRYPDYAWEVERLDPLEVKFGGSTEAYIDEQGHYRVRWLATETIRGIAYDTPVSGYRTQTVNLVRLWRAESAEPLCQVRYATDSEPQQALQLKQQFFLVSCALQDALRMHLQAGATPETLHQRFALQLNDANTAIGVAELMRLLVDEVGMNWEQAWAVTQQTLTYTSHHLSSEAFDEQWPINLLGNLLPRHLEIIYEINYRLLEAVKAKYPNDTARLKRMSLIDEQGERFLRSNYLACVGSHAVNGTSTLHTQQLQQSILRDFFELHPEKFSHITNGIAARRFLLQANPNLSALISSRIGDRWITELDQLQALESGAEDPEFCRAWRQTKQAAKQALAASIYQQGIDIDPNSLFDVQATAIQESKRQHLNLLHILTLYNRIKANPFLDITPRTFIFAGKAAPDDFSAKLMIKLIHAVAELVNRDPALQGKLKVAFWKNLNPKSAQLLYAAADLAEYIAVAGTDTIDPGNLIFALNGALLIGTPNGINSDIMQAIGRENCFQFGLTASEAAAQRAQGYSSMQLYNTNWELQAALDLLTSGKLSNGDTERFRPLVNLLLYSDPHMLLTDYPAYLAAQSQVDQAYRDSNRWTQQSILSVARMGNFSADRAICEYSQLWQTSTVLFPLQEGPPAKKLIG